MNDTNSYNADVNALTGAFGPKAYARWPYNAHTKNIYSLGAAPLIYKNGTYTTAYSANAEDLFMNSHEGKESAFGRRSRRKRKSKRRKSRKRKRKSRKRKRKSRRKRRGSKKKRSFLKFW